MRHTHGPGGWRRFLRWLLPGRGTTPTRVTASWAEPPGVHAGGAGSVAVGGDSTASISTRVTGAADRPARDRSAPVYRTGRAKAGPPVGTRTDTNPLADPMHPTHQAIYGGPFWGAGRADSSPSSTSDCGDRPPSHDSGSSYGGGHSSHDAGSSSYGGGGSSSSYDGGGSSCSGGDSGGSW